MSLDESLGGARYRVLTDGALAQGASREGALLELTRVLGDESLAERALGGGVHLLVPDLADEDATALVRRFESVGLHVFRELEPLVPELSLGEPSLSRGREAEKPSLTALDEVFADELDRGTYGAHDTWQGSDAHAIALEPTQDAPAEPSTSQWTSAPRAPRGSSRFVGTPVHLSFDVDTPAPPAGPFAIEGRIGRVRYLMRAQLLPWLLLLGSAALVPFGPRIFLAGYLIAAFVSFVMAVCASVARLHDIGVSGAIVLVLSLSGCLLQPMLVCGVGAEALSSQALSLLLGLASFVLWLVSLFWPGQAGANRYGSPPLADTPVYRVVVVITALTIVVAMLAVYRAIEHSLPELFEQLRQQRERMGIRSL